MALELIPEEERFAAPIDAMLQRAFGPGRFAKTSERVREAGARPRPDLSRMALDEEGRPVGVCRLYEVEAGGAPILFLGPLAVDPAAQRDGLGAALVRAAVSAAREDGASMIVLVGAESFFAPHGFVRVPAGRLQLPGPVDGARLLWVELSPGAQDRISGAILPPRDAK